MVDEINRTAVLIGDDYRAFKMISGGLFLGIVSIIGIIIYSIIVSTARTAILSDIPQRYPYNRLPSFVWLLTTHLVTHSITISSLTFRGVAFLLLFFFVLQARLIPPYLPGKYTVRPTL